MVDYCDSRWYGLASRDTNDTSAAAAAATILDSTTSTPDAIRYVHFFIWQRRRMFAHRTQLSAHVHHRYAAPSPAPSSVAVTPTASPSTALSSNAAQSTTSTSPLTANKSRARRVHIEDTFIERIWPWKEGMQKTRQELGYFRQRLENWIERLDWDAERRFLAKFDHGTKLRYADPDECRADVDHEGAEQTYMLHAEECPTDSRRENQQQADQAVRSPDTVEESVGDVSLQAPLSLVEDHDTIAAKSLIFTTMDQPSTNDQPFPIKEQPRLTAHHSNASTVYCSDQEVNITPEAQQQHGTADSSQDSFTTATRTAVDILPLAERLEQALASAEREKVEHNHRAAARRLEMQERELDRLAQSLTSAVGEREELNARVAMQNREIESLQRCLASTKREAQEHEARAERQYQQCQSLYQTLSEEKIKSTELDRLSSKQFDMLKELTCEKREAEVELSRWRERESRLVEEIYHRHLELEQEVDQKRLMLDQEIGQERSQLDQEISQARAQLDQEIREAHGSLQLQQDVLKADLTRLIQISEEVGQRRLRDVIERLSASQQQGQLLEEKLHTLDAQWQSAQADLHSTQTALHSTQTALHSTRDALHSAKSALHSSRSALESSEASLGAATQENAHLQCALHAAHASEDRCLTTHRELFISQQAYYTGQLARFNDQTSAYTSARRPA